MSALLYNLFCFIGLLCCLYGQTNGKSSPELYSLEKTENSFDSVLWSSDNSISKTQFWNTVSDFFNYNFKVLEIFVSKINWRNYDEIQSLNISTMPTKQFFSNFGNRKFERNIPKRIHRQANIIQINNSLIQQSTTLSSVISITTKGIKIQSNLNHSLTNNSKSTNINKNQSLVSSTSPSTFLNSADSTLISSPINSTPMTSTDLPLTSSTTVVIDNQTFSTNTTNKDKIKILSDTLPDKQNYYAITAIFLSAIIILAIGILIVYTKYLDTGRRAFYQIGGICHGNAHEETPV